METTNYYHNNNLVNREKLLTLTEYVQLGKLKPGQKLLLLKRTSLPNNKVKGNVTVTIVIGDATPYCMPSESDAEIGWPLDYTDKFNVTEVHTHN